MGDSKHFKHFALSEKKILWVNKFKGTDYVHIKDRVKDKSMTFTVQEFRAFYTKKNKIVNLIKQVTNSTQKRKHDSDDEDFVTTAGECTPKKKKKKTSWELDVSDDEECSDQDPNDW